MPQGFFPSRDGDFMIWEDNFATKVSAIGLQLGFTNEEITVLLDQITAHKGTYAKVVQARREANAATEKNDAQKTKAKVAMSKFAKRAKTHASYTDDLGKELGIVSTGEAEARATIKPILSVKSAGGQIKITFKKYKTDGIKLYSKRAGETAFSFLATDTASPYIDSRPCLVENQPETREYYAYHFINDEQVGQPSDVIKITCS